MNMNGKIIVITGTDGSGKETQAKKLYEALKNEGKNVKMQSFPCYESKATGPVKMYLGGELSETANEIDAYQASTLFAVDHFCTMKKYEKFLEEGGVLLLDRYMESNIIHQASKIEDKAEQEKYISWLLDFEFNALKIPPANHIIFLDMPPKYSIMLARSRSSLKNGAEKDIHERDNTHLENAYKNGIYFAKKMGWDIVECVENDKILTIEEIHKKILNIVMKH